MLNVYWVSVAVFIYAAGPIELTIVARVCNSSNPLTAAGQIPLNIADRCVSGLFSYNFEGFSIDNVNATVCPCFTELCNAGNITLGGTAATVTPHTLATTTPPTPTTQTESVGDATSTTTSSATKSNQPLPNFIIAAISVVVLCGY